MVARVKELMNLPSSTQDGKQGVAKPAAVTFQLPNPEAFLLKNFNVDLQKYSVPAAPADRSVTRPGDILFLFFLFFYVLIRHVFFVIFLFIV